MSVLISLETSTHYQLGTITAESPDDIKPGEHVTVTGLDSVKRRCRILDRPQQAKLNGEVQKDIFWCYAACTIVIVDEP